MCLNRRTKYYLRVQFRTSRSIDNCAVRTAIVVGADELFVSDSEDAGHVGLGRNAECRDNFLEGGGLFGADGEIDHGDVGSGPG